MRVVSHRRLWYGKALDVPPARRTRCERSYRPRGVRRRNAPRPAGGRTGEGGHRGTQVVRSESREGGLWPPAWGGEGGRHEEEWVRNTVKARVLARSWRRLARPARRPRA